MKIDLEKRDGVWKASVVKPSKAVLSIVFNPLKDDHKFFEELANRFKTPDDQ